MNDTNRKTGPLAPAVVITGATQGIGRALADEFAREGHALFLIARDAAKLAEVARDLAERHKVEVRAASCDLCTEEGCARVEDALAQSGFYADVLVNNAAAMTAGFFQDEDLSKLRQLVDLNIRAMVDLTRRFLPGMLARRSGGVLTVASLEGYMPVPYQATYAASKAFVLSLSRALSYETLWTGVRISVVAPGPIATEMHAKAGAEHSRYYLYLPVMSPEDLARTAYRGFKRGKRVIVTGWFNRFAAFAYRFTPDFLLLPLMGLLFRVLDADGNVQMPKKLPAPETLGTRPTREEKTGV